MPNDDVVRISQKMCRRGWEHLEQRWKRVDIHDGYFIFRRYNKTMHVACHPTDITLSEVIFGKRDATAEVRCHRFRFRYPPGKKAL